MAANQQQENKEHGVFWSEGSPACLFNFSVLEEHFEGIIKKTLRVAAEIKKP